MNEPNIIQVTCNYRDILISLIDALDENNLGIVSEHIKDDLSKLDKIAKQIPQLSRIIQE